MSRPRPPIVSIPGLPGTVSDTDLRAVAWAKEWHGEPIEKSDAELLALARQSIDGAALKERALGTPAYLVVAAAVKLVRFLSQRQRMLRTTRALPLALFSANAECCAAAQKLDGKRFPVAKLPTIPLEGCDTARCYCHVRAVAK